MSNGRKFVILFTFIIVLSSVFFVSRKMRKNKKYSIERNSILQEAREAKKMKAALKNNEDNEIQK